MLVELLILDLALLSACVVTALIFWLLRHRLERFRHSIASAPRIVMVQAVIMPLPALAAGAIAGVGVNLLTIDDVEGQGDRDPGALAQHLAGAYSLLFLAAIVLAMYGREVMKALHRPRGVWLSGRLWRSMDELMVQDWRNVPVVERDAARRRLARMDRLAAWYDRRVADLGWWRWFRRRAWPVRAYFMVNSLVGLVYLAGAASLLAEESLTDIPAIAFQVAVLNLAGPVTLLLWRSIEDHELQFRRDALRHSAKVARQRLQRREEIEARQVRDAQPVRQPASVRAAALALLTAITSRVSHGRRSAIDRRARGAGSGGGVSHRCCAGGSTCRR